MWCITKEGVLSNDSAFARRNTLIKGKRVYSHRREDNKYLKYLLYCYSLLFPPEDTHGTSDLRQGHFVQRPFFLPLFFHTQLNNNKQHYYLLSHHIYNKQGLHLYLYIYMKRKMESIYNKYYTYQPKIPTHIYIYIHTYITLFIIHIR